MQKARDPAIWNTDKIYSFSVEETMSSMFSCQIKYGQP